MLIEIRTVSAKSPHVFTDNRYSKKYSPEPPVNVAVVFLTVSGETEEPVVKAVHRISAFEPVLLGITGELPVNDADVEPDAKHWSLPAFGIGGLYVPEVVIETELVSESQKLDIIQLKT